MEHGGSDDVRSTGALSKASPAPPDLRQRPVGQQTHWVSSPKLCSHGHSLSPKPASAMLNASVHTRCPQTWVSELQAPGLYQVLEAPEVACRATPHCGTYHQAPKSNTNRPIPTIAPSPKASTCLHQALLD